MFDPVESLLLAQQLEENLGVAPTPCQGRIRDAKSLLACLEELQKNDPATIRQEL